jgi:hypothetical protein
MTIRRVQGELILVAHCQLRAAQRTFKVERIVQLTRMDAPAVAAALSTLVRCDDPVPSDSSETGSAAPDSVVTPYNGTVESPTMAPPPEPVDLPPDAGVSVDPGPLDNACGPS